MRHQGRFGPHDVHGSQGMDVHRKVHHRLRNNFFGRTVGSAKVRTNTEGDRNASHCDTLDRILSTAGFIVSPEGAAEDIQGIFVDTEIARIIE